MRLLAGCRADPSSLSVEIAAVPPATSARRHYGRRALDRVARFSVSR
jgi:hypothetical protein